MSELRLRDGASSADLRTFAGRAARLDPGAALRLVARGGVLAVYAAALHGGAGPTVLGLRTLVLAEPASLDVTVPVAALLPLLDDGLGLALPDVPDRSVPVSSWAGVLPPQRGWSFDGVLDPGLLRTAARDGISEVAAGTPPSAGSAAVTALRTRVWARPLPGGSVPAGVAFAVRAFGFLGPSTSSGDEPVSLHRSGPWWRVSTERGHVLARAASPL